MDKFLDEAANQNHPLRALRDFLEKEDSLETAKLHEQRKFVGYVLDIGYDEVTIMTCDPFKISVGGIPRNSLLIMCPSSFENDGISVPPHFTLLRVLDTAPTPLSNEVQQTYFELQKKSMPELDIFTQSELQWGALKTSVLGMFYPHPSKRDAIEFSGDMNNYVSAHKYRIFAPDETLLDLVNNTLVPQENRFSIGKLRMTECRLPLPDKSLPDVDIYLSTKDFLGSRTAMFGKTRLGKSNVVKLIAQSILETTKSSKNVGQLIFDINGEYANDNPQDDNYSLRSAYQDQCVVYALNQKPETPSELLKLNFYEDASSSKQVLNSLIRQSGRNISDYINAFLSVELPELDNIDGLPINDKIRAIRRLQYYWALLKKAQYTVDEAALRKVIPNAGNTRGFTPGFSAGLRDAAYKFANEPTTPSEPNSLSALVRELETIILFKRENRSSPLLNSASGNAVFEQDDNAILEILEPQPGRSGIIILLPFRVYHDQNAGNYKDSIIKLIDEGITVILDLGNANEEVVQYFSRQLSEAVFYHQMDKFTSNTLGDHFVQLYFEEAHNLFSSNDNDDATKIYRRFAKEGAKYHIGMVYSTQSPTTISTDLLAQTENFFVAHLASEDDVNRLAKLNVAYTSMKGDILQAKTVGYIRMLTSSHRFVVSLQAHRFTRPIKEI
ncbi:ATP-binding protein [Chloroflexota bacterium]